MSTELKTLANPFSFNNIDIHIAVDEQYIWFNAMDVCRAIDVPWSEDLLAVLPDDWMMSLKFEDDEGISSAWFINAPGLYRLLFDPPREVSILFSNWAHYDLWPVIKQNGFFPQLTSSERISCSDQIVNILGQLNQDHSSQAQSILIAELRDCCNLIGRRVPDLDLVGHNFTDLRKLITSLRASAKVIAATIDDESINSDEAFALISTIADRIEAWMEQHKNGFIRHKFRK